MSEILIVDNLSKHFRSHWTFRKRFGIEGVSFSINEGEIFGFLGHNGAGKTTTMKCILGLLRANSGRVIFCGKSLTEYNQREQIGYLPELPYFYDHLSVEETLRFFSCLYGIDTKRSKQRMDCVIERVGLSDRKKDEVRALSKGLQQRLAFAQAILNEPTLVFLDEPFSGLDPIGRAEFRKLILELNENGVAILISSHILPDIQNICDKVAIMAHGRIRKEITIEELSNAERKVFVLGVKDLSSLSLLNNIMGDRILRSSSIDRIEKRRKNFFELEFGNCKDLSDALSLAISKGLEIVHLESKEKQLEEVFIEVMNEF